MCFQNIASRTLTVAFAILVSVSLLGVTAGPVA